jgi:hypothetical protein
VWAVIIGRRLYRRLLVACEAWWVGSNGYMTMVGGFQAKSKKRSEKQKAKRKNAKGSERNKSVNARIQTNGYMTNGYMDKSVKHGSRPTDI